MLSKSPQRKVPKIARAINIAYQRNKSQRQIKLIIQLFQHSSISILLYQLSNQMKEQLGRGDSYTRLHTKAMRLHNKGSRETVMLAMNLRQAIALAIFKLDRQLGSHKNSDECSIYINKAQSSTRNMWKSTPQGKVIGFSIKAGNWCTYKLQLDDDEYGAHINLQLYGISYSIYYSVRFPDHEEKNRQKQAQVQDVDPYALIQSQANRFKSEIKPGFKIQRNQIARGIVAMVVIIAIIWIFTFKASSWAVFGDLL